MVKKPVGPHKHVPQRTCVGCGQILAKRSLVRIVRTLEGVRVDLTGKAAGRGVYLHNLRSCWEQGLKGKLAHSLKVTLTEQEREQLTAYMENIPAETKQDQAGLQV
jgi:uncharacterized protein